MIFLKRKLKNFFDKRRNRCLNNKNKSNFNRIPVKLSEKLKLPFEHRSNLDIAVQSASLCQPN